MLVCMRTTINLPDALAEAAKTRASVENRTFTSVIEEGLRLLLSTEPETAEQHPLPAYGDPDDTILVDLMDRDALEDALDADGLR
jgi:hypothetical protein